VFTAHHSKTLAIGVVAFVVVVTDQTKRVYRHLLGCPVGALPFGAHETRAHMASYFSEKKLFVFGFRKENCSFLSFVKVKMQKKLKLE
jgi:hypothetical protein